MVPLVMEALHAAQVRVTQLHARVYPGHMEMIRYLKGLGCRIGDLQEDLLERCDRESGAKPRI